MEANNERRAFVIMPFDPEFNTIYSDLIRPALEEAGYEVARADSFLNQQNILRDIVRGIATSDLIIAELTTLNPNVLYELGLAHGLRIPTILLAQSIDEVPFDLRVYRILVYSIRFDQVHKLKQSLKDIGERHRSGEIAFGSPIIDFYPREMAASTLAISRRPVELARIETDHTIQPSKHEADDEKGFLDYLAEGEDASANIAEIMQAMSADTAGIGERLKGYTEQIQATSPMPGAATRIRNIALIVASDMDGYSRKIEGYLPRFEESVDALAESYTGYVAWFDPHLDEHRNQLDTFRQAVASLLEAARQGIFGVRSFRDAVDQLSSQKLNRDISRTGHRLTEILDRVLMSMEKVEALCVATFTSINEKLYDDSSLAVAQV
jgi:hypothetical protein